MVKFKAKNRNLVVFGEIGKKSVKVATFKDGFVELDEKAQKAKVDFLKKNAKDLGVEEVKAAKEPAAPAGEPEGNGAGNPEE